MSTLSEMASLICTELGLFDDTSIALCKQFLNRQYVTLWDKYPWIDANGGGGGVVQVPAGTARVNYPDGMDRLITLRISQFIPGMAPPAMPDAPDAPAFDPDAPDDPNMVADARFLDSVDPTFLMESDPGIFERYGYVKYYQDRAQGGLRVVRLYPVPNMDITLFFWGKMICPGLTDDDSICLIRNLEPAIMAYAYFDMLQRQRQYGKADLKRKEAQELETNAWNLEQQQANQPRRTKATTVAGNSLAEMTDAVCMICGQWTPEYRQIIHEFLRRNYQTLYDIYLWPESLIVVLMPYSSDQLILPYYIDRVLAVRSPGKFRMTQLDGPVIFDLNPTVFGETGDPISYTTLTPVAVSILPPTTSQLVLASTSAVDVSDVAIRGEVITAGQEVEEIVTLRGTTPVTTRYAYNTPLTIAKDITVGNVTINANDDAFTLLGSLRSYLREKKHQRLWLLPPLSATDNDGTRKLLVMGKRAIVPLVSPQDTPIITGVQQVLIAAAAADLFRKLEKHDMANAFQQKASGSTDVLKAKNTDQAANSPRFVPQIEPRSYTAGCVW